MVICTLVGPSEVGPWKKICSLEHRDSLPTDSVIDACPNWKERVLENSLLRQSDVLARAIGVPTTEHSIALKQVARIDLYLRTREGLHLFEVKRPQAEREWLSAATQIAQQWGRQGHWLRRGDEPVSLWAVCPVRWTRPTAGPDLPTGWRTALAAIKPETANLGLLFYSILQGADEQTLILWRCDEPTPMLERS